MLIPTKHPQLQLQLSHNKIATGETEDTKLKQHARQKSGIEGSKERYKSLTSKQRSESARNAANAR